MAIDGIGRYAGLQTYAPREITRVTPEEVRKQDEEKKAQVAQQSAGLSSPYSQEDQKKAERVANLEDVSFSFRKNDDVYPMIGRDVSLEALDAEKNVSEMTRDKVLSGYRFFVGDLPGAPSVIDTGLGFVRFSSEDGAVVVK